MKTDWLASTPIFYNEKTKRVSENINDVIDWKNLEFDGEGLNNYLDIGYSVFGQTPVKHIKFLLPNQELVVDKNKLIVRDLVDPVEKHLGKKTKESDVIEVIQSKVRAWEKKTKGDIVVPTSGGYDSRLLNIFIKDKSRIKSFSYGVSDDQSKSFEVIYAKELSNKLGTRWQQIELGEYHKYFDEWDDLYGISTHAHGMYHIEFYKKILKVIDRPQAFLSGVIGDGWSGNVKIGEIKSSVDVFKLGYSHGMHSSSQFCLLNSDKKLLRDYYERNKEKLINDRWRIVESMRMKMTLLSYLVKLPKSFGFDTYSPFLDVEVATAMLNLPDERRLNRVWQSDYLKKVGCYFENQNIKVDRHNTLNLQAMEKVPLKPLDTKILSEVIDGKYIEEINRRVMVAEKLPTYRGWQKWFDVLKVPVNIYTLGSKTAMAYNAYLTLKPIEQLLKRRNKS